MNEEFYISIVGEIFDGYTELDLDGRLVYLKHLTVKDQRYIHLYYDKYKNIALKKGVDSEESLLKDLKKDDLWSDEDDLRIESLKSEVENLKKTQKSLFLKSQKDKLGEEILEKKNTWVNLMLKRKELVGKTAEDYASSMASIEMIRYFLFDSKNLDNHAFSKEEFDEMDDSLLSKLTKIQKELGEKMNELTLQKTVLRPFFGLYLSFCENPKDFYGSPLVELSVFQLKLVLFGRMFHGIFQYTEDIPDHIKEDPERLIGFSESKNKKDGGNKKFIDENAAASTVFGATSEDIKDLVKNEEGSISLTDEIKKAGGKLSMDEMIKLAGQ